MKCVVQVISIAMRSASLLIGILKRSCVVGYSLPTFNLSCRIWRPANTVANPPDVISACNFAGGERQLAPEPPMITTAGAQLNAAFQRMAPFQSLLLPKGADIRPPDTAGPPFAGDCVEIPSGSGVYYAVVGVCDIGRGFQNEHRCAFVVLHTNGWKAVTLNPWATPALPYPLP